MPTGVHCIYGICPNDKRHPKDGVSFHPFPKPCLGFRTSGYSRFYAPVSFDRKAVLRFVKDHVAECKTCEHCNQWVWKCKRKDGRFDTISDIRKNTAVCSDHFPPHHLSGSGQLFPWGQDYDEGENEYAGSNEEEQVHTSVHRMPAAALMERTSSSLAFFQHILKSESSAALQIAWSVFLREMSEDLAEIEEKFVSLQRNCKFKDQELLDNASAYEELQTQLENEKKEMLVQERLAATKATEDLRNRVRHLEAELSEAMEIKNELVSKFNTLFRKKRTSKLKKEQLVHEVDDLTHEVEMQKDVIAQLKKALNTSRSEIEEECERSYHEGYEYGRHVATIEELGVLEQFKILRDIEAILEMDLRKEQQLGSESNV